MMRPITLKGYIAFSRTNGFGRGRQMIFDLESLFCSQ